ncbi:hypothetical protein BLNAU_15734 [Blattamonas nauphoetae]|uniref:Uncharacterized protein n=1 Tax=Blattamonas nauphoetae TaxID=2049346 RepID=A0ABQ9XCG0_9EUKA|nr:hypothetical protein BLNAU_15734 [Blattamonas nauphoetae]
MISWCLDVQESGCSACLLSSSDLTIEGSEIISNMDCSPFIVSGDLDGCGNQIQIIRSSHKSTSNTVLPLVATSQDQRGIDLGTELMNEMALHPASPQSLSIGGVGLSMTNQHFPLGTGPLFTFQSHHAFDSAIAVGTNLVESSLVNVTSSSPSSPGKQHFGSEVRQLVVGSCVRKSTNHDSGTGMMSPNFGGNLKCLNTSFSSCVRQRNTELSFSFENRTNSSDPARLNNVTSDVTSVSFTLCTFNEMTVADGNLGGGAAILLFQTSSSLTITTCYFHKCTCTADNDDGGAICFKYSLTSKKPISISASSFADCSANDCGGSILALNASSSLIDKCIFEWSKADKDGAVFIRSDAMTVSNTAFVDCSASSRAGTIYVHQVTTLSLSFIPFRGCASTKDPNGKDIYFSENSSTQITSDMIQSCDSTSGEPNVYFQKDSKISSTLVPQIDPSTNVTIMSFDVAFDENEATVSVTTTKPIKGTMAVLLDGSNVPRLVHVVFGDDTTTSNLGTAVVSSGENGILPRADYVFRSAAVTGYRIFVGPFIFEASSTLDGLSTAEIVVKGANLEEGSYWMVIRKEEFERNIPLTLSNSTTLTGTAQLDSTPEDGLEWSTEYDVTKVTWDGNGVELEQAIPLRESLTLTTPAEPPRITSVDCALNGKKDVVIVELTGRKLTSDGQTLAVVSRTSNELTSSGELFNVTSTKCFVNFSIGSSESSTHVVFGGTYDLKSFESELSSIAVKSGLFFEVPHPPRITSLTPETEVSSSTFVLSVSGENLPSGKTFTVTLISGHSFSVTFSSTSGGTSTINIGGSGQLQYNTDYTIKSVIRTVDGEDDHILLSASSFKTPLGPTLSLISSQLSSSNPNFLNLTLSTQRMPPETFTLTLKSTESPSETIFLTITSSEISTGFVLVEVYNKTGTLKYGTTYSIDGMNSSSVVVVVAAPAFWTPSEPIRITSAGCSLGDDKQKSAVVTLNGVKLGGEKGFAVGVRKMEGSTLIGDEIELTGTLSGDSSSTTHIHTELIFGNTNALLSFGTKYQITRLEVSGSVCVVDANVTFSVPAEPARLTFLVSVVQYSSDEKKATISLSGIGMEGDYNLTLSVNSSSSNNVTLLAPFDDDGRGSLTAVLFSSSDHKPSTLNLPILQICHTSS